MSNIAMLKVLEVLKDKVNSGNLPWIKNWKNIPTINYISRKCYNGLNFLMLDGGEYATFNQVKSCNGIVKKGAKGSPVVFYKLLTKKDDPEKVFPLLRYSTVFNISDTTLESKLELNQNQKVASLELQYLKTLQLTEKFSNKAYYNVDNDYIVVPDASQFTNSNEYYQVLFHEAIHSTGHKDRLNRFQSSDFKNRSAYSFEELIAEIGTCMLMKLKGLEPNFDNSGSYLNSWLKVLKSDIKMLATAGILAQKAVNYILSFESNYNIETIESEE